MSLRHMAVTTLEPCGTEEERECGVREILERIGDKWTVLVIAELSPGPKRFRQLQRSIHGISQRMLTLTVRRLERDGLLTRTVKATVPPQVTYTLTEEGLSLSRVVRRLVDWATHHEDQIHSNRAAWDARHVVESASTP